MRNFLLSTFCFFSIFSFSQGIEIDTTSLTIPQIVNTILMNNSCSNVTNLKYSSHVGIGQFTNTNMGFPLSKGMIIRNGVAKYTEGVFTGKNESSQISKLGDLDLQKISDSNGQNKALIDVTYLEFEFTPLTSNFSFDFVFASNEYGEFQCGFSDVFAFLLTDISTGVTSNLAVIPSTSIPVSVKNIRDSAYNASCVSSNSNLFSHYNVIDPTHSAINMRGETVLMTASSTVVPHRTYRIKLAIGDYADSKYDSAVFIKEGSFVTTADLGPDRTICDGESILLDSKLSGLFEYSWSWNDTLIPGEKKSTLNVTKSGKYKLTASLPGSGCLITDEIVVADLVINSPLNLSVCNAGLASYKYDLTQNNSKTLGLNSSNYAIVYFASLIDANANTPQIPLEQLTAYESPGNQSIYIKIRPLAEGNTICNNLFSFDLLLKSFVVNPPPPISVCLGSTQTATIDLTVQNRVIIDGQNSASFNFFYYLTKEDAQNNTNPILNPSAFTAIDSQSSTHIWVRVEDVLGKACFQLVSFDIIVHLNPPVDRIANVIECDHYVLPTITNGSYFTGPNGTGTALFAGDSITVGGTYYIFNTSSDNPKCVNQSLFNVVFIDELVFSTTACGNYIVPLVPFGNFFTEPGGTGTMLPSGTSLSSNQIIYYYAVINEVVCRDEALSIIITPLPIVDSPSDVITCDSYVLPPLNNGNYFTESEGKGKPLFAGDVVNKSQDIYVFGLNGICSNQNKFRVNIVDTSIYTQISACGEFVLPQIPFGNYYDQPLGKGSQIPAGTVITSSQNMYYYVKTTTFPNCTENLFYQITIKNKPVLDQVANRLECERYFLPPLTNGNYYTAANGGGMLLKPGELITKTQKIYLYAVAPNGCSNEKNFTVEIRTLPPVDNFTDVFTCDPFVLPRLTYGNYYTASGGPNGKGVKIEVGSVITSTQTIFIYNEWNDLKSCNNESFFKVDVLGIDVGTFSDVNACDSYTLPPLSIGNYYSQPNGQGPIISAGTVLYNSQTIYVYATVGNRLTCSDEDSFIVTISTTPVLIKHPDIEACGSYSLPVLEKGHYFSGSNETGTAYFNGQNISTSQKIYIYAKSPTNSTCYAQDDFNLIVYPLKNLIVKSGSICVDNKTGKVVQPFELVSGLDPTIYNVDWYLKGVLMGTGPNYLAIQEGIYNVIITKKTPDRGNDCGYNLAKVIVDKSSKAIAKATASSSFEDNIDIIVTVTGGFGVYEYQLDNGIFQTDTTFHSVTSGKHSITIKDTKADCGTTVIDINVLKYPKYFTPNSDGFNDTWNILDLSFQTDALIYIYDRYGKLIKQLNPSGKGWDGTFNGQDLPETDYWFEVFYKMDGVDQFFKSNFSLKR